MAIYTNASGLTVDEAKVGVKTPEDWASQGFSVITPEALKPEPPIDLAPKEQDTTNYQGIIDSGSALSGSLTKPDTQQTDTNSLQSMLAGLTAPPTGLTAPPSGAALYESTYGAGPTQQEVSALETNKINAQKDFDLVQSEIVALNAEAKAAPIQVQQDSFGRGITAGGAKPFETAKLRDIALRSLPLEGKLMAAQAVLTNNTNLLSAAKAKFDKVFELRLTDMQNQYNYKKDQQDKIWNYLTQKEQDRLTDIRQQDQNKFTLLRDTINNLKDLATKALDSGQADLAAKITALDPKSPTFAADLAKLQSQIKTTDSNLETQVVDTGSGKVLINTQTGEVIKDLSGGEWTYVSTPAERDRLKALGYEIKQEMVNGQLKTFTRPPTESEWSEPYKLGGDYVQKNNQTGEIRTAVNMPAGGGGGTKNYTGATIPADIKTDLLADVKAGNSVQDVMAAYPEVDTSYIQSLYPKSSDGNLF